MTNQPPFTIDQIIGRYVEVRDEVKEANAAHKKALEPLQAKMKTLGQVMLATLNANKVESLKTEAGTVYRRLITSVTIDQENDGWAALLRYIVEQAIEAGLNVAEEGGDDEAALQAALQVPGFALLNHAVSKTAVEEFVEQHKALPPGVKFVQIYDVGVRRGADDEGEAGK